MMKKSYILILAAVLGIFAAGCQKDNVMHRFNSFRVMTTNFGDQQAKIYFSFSSDLSSLCYNDGDKVLVNGSSFTLDSSASGWVANADNGEDVEAERFYCIYSTPNMSINGSGNGYNFSTAFTNENGLSVATHNGVLLAGSTQDSLLTLNPACAILRFPAEGAVMDYVYVGFTGSKIPYSGRISISDAGEATITPSNYMAVPNSMGGGNFLKMVRDKNNNSYFVAVPIVGSGVSTQLYFRWKYNSSSDIYTFKTTGNVTLQRGKVYTIATSRVAPFQTDGSSKSYFQVSNGRNGYVRFSPGNLQCNPASSYRWRFAPYQYTFTGYDNNDIQYYDGCSTWIDLFAWAGTGWTTGGTTYYPDEYSTTGDYYSGDDIAGTNGDWGQYLSGSIYYGDVQSSATWRTLTQSEWNFLLSGRTNAASKWGLATVGSTNGLVLIPDGIQEDGGTSSAWSDPLGTFTAGSGSGYSTNTYTTDEWSQMEAAGAIFLPAGGFRDVTTVNAYSGSGQSSIEGHYWTTTGVSGGTSAYEMSFMLFGGDWYVDADADNVRRMGCAVRLVRAK